MISRQRQVGGRQQLARRFTRCRWLAGWALVMAWLLLPRSEVLAETDPEDRGLQAMCQHGLAETAIRYVTAQRQIAATDEARARWTMRLMECHAWAALYAAEEAAAHWASCASIQQEFADAHATSPRLPWVQWQALRCDLLHAQSALASYLAVPAKTELRERALEKVRAIMRASETLLDDLSRRQPLAAREGPRGGAQAPVEELHKLALDVALLQCEALLIRGGLYDPQSADRLAAATEVTARAEEVLARSAEQWSGREQLAVARAIAELDLGRRAEALLELERLARDASQRLVRIRAAVTAIAALAAERQSSRAQPLLEYLDQAAAGPELALARLELQLAEVAAIAEENQSAALEKLVNDAAAIGRNFGDYWRNRAEARLVGSVASGSVQNAGVAQELMLVEVRQLLASGDTQAAIDKLLQFRDNQAAAADGAAALRLASQAAALLQRENRWPESRAAVDPILERFPAAEGAAEAHWLVVWSAAQQLRQAPEDPQLSEAYETALAHQLQAWPDASVSSQAQAWLTSWWGAKSRHVELLDVVQRRARQAKDPQVSRACLSQWLETVLQLPQLEQHSQCLVALRQQPNDWQQPSALASAQVAACVAEIYGSWLPNPRAQEVLGELRRLPTASLDALDQQLLVAVQLLQAIRDNRSEGLTSLTDRWQPSQLSSQLRIGLAPALVAAIDETPFDEQPGWVARAGLQADWIDDLKNSPRAAERVLAFRIIAWVDNPSEGLAGIAEHIAQSPRDGELQLQMARALAASGKNRWQDSMQLAKQIAASSPAASELNLSARWLLIKVQLLAGERTAAQQAAKLLLATRPDLSQLWRQRLQAAL